VGWRLRGGGQLAAVSSFVTAFRPRPLQNVDQSETLYVSTHAYGIYRHWPLQSSSNYNYEGVNLLKFGWAPGVLGNASVDETEALAYNVNGPSGAWQYCYDCCCVHASQRA